MARPRSPWIRWLTRTVGHRAEAALVYTVFAVFRALPVDAASALGGWLGRVIGPHLPSSATAHRNLARAFPAMPAAGRAAVVRDMWDNLGRTIAEYPHLEAFLDFGPGRRIEVVGLEHLVAQRDDGRPGFMVGGHIGNWEIGPVVGKGHGLDMAVVFRAPNNPYVARLLTRLRAPVAGEQVPKGPDGARRILRLIGHGQHIGILIDQKMNDGIAVPFFGRPAMTAPAAAQLALRHRLPVCMVRGERLGGARFRYTIMPPEDMPATGERTGDVRALTERLTARLESWIRERPAQWLWLHRRWPD
jgi:KDO2-lipid IV(A) lauroyltransferase